MKLRLTFPCIVVLVAPVFAQDPAPERGPLRLTLKRAVELALSPEGNAQIQLAQEAVKQAESRSAQARSALLPDLEGTFGKQSVTRNLAAIGLQQVELPFGRIPRFVGPFDVTDARATVTQNIFDFSSIRHFQSSRAALRASRAERENTDDQVAAAVAKAYLSALRAAAEVEAANANLTLAQAVWEEAQHQKEVGTGTGIEVTRAQVQVANEQQRLLVAENQRTRAYLQLLKIMGRRLDTDVDLTDKLTYTPVDVAAIDAAVQNALRSRSDLKSQQQREESARLASSATKMERLPSLVGFADYGAIGPALDSALPTRTYGVSLRVPIFDGGRRDARRGEAESQFRQEQVRTRDLRDQVELEIRLALDSLRSAEEQVTVAEQGLALAQNELAQARRRYDAGVTTGLEVTDAQTRLERAQDNRIAALFNHNLARIDLGQAMGAIRSMIQ